MSQRPAPHNDLRRLLVDAVLAAPSADSTTLSEGDLEMLESAAAIHRIRPAVHRLLIRASVGTNRTSVFATAAAAQNVRHLRTLADLDHLSQTLATAGIPWVVGKGPVAAARIWPSADMREYFDLDIYVSPDHFAAAVDALEAAGCTGLDRNWPEMRRQMRAEYAMRGRFQTPLDIHWDIAVRPEIRRMFTFDLDAMIERARPVELGRGRYPTFDVVDTVLLLGFHAAQAGANRLMWLGDLYYATDDPEFNWPALAHRADQARARLPISIAMERTARVLRTSAPSPVGPPRSGRAWARFVRWYDRRQPAVFLPGDPHAAGGPVGAARPTLRASLHAAIRGRREIRRGERAVARFGQPSNPLDEDVPDIAARAAYMDAATARSAG